MVICRQISWNSLLVVRNFFGFSTGKIIFKESPSLPLLRLYLGVASLAILVLVHASGSEI